MLGAGPRPPGRAGKQASLARGAHAPGAGRPSRRVLPPRAQVHHTVYMWPMVAFATATVLNILSYIFERRTTKKQLCFLAIYISSAAFIYEFLAWQGWAPIYVTASGRPNSILR